MDPSGRFVYLTGEGGVNPTHDEISAWMHPNPGTLVPIESAPFVIPAFLRGPPVFGSGSKYLYVGATDNNGLSGVWAFSIDPNSGALTQIPGSPFTIGQAPYGLVIATDPSGKFIFTSAIGVDKGVFVLAIDTNSGSLTAVQGSPFVTEGMVETLFVDPTGPFLYFSSASGGLLVFSIDTTGQLQPIAGSPFLLGQHFTKFAFGL